MGRDIKDSRKGDAVDDKDLATEPEVTFKFGDDIFARAQAAMVVLQKRDFTSSTTMVDVEIALDLVSKALGALANIWPALEGVRVVVNFAKACFAANSKEKIQDRIAGIRLMQADLICSLFRLKDVSPSSEINLQKICNSVQDYLNQLGNLIKEYTEEKAIGRVLKEQGWKKAITEYGTMVKRGKAEIDRFLMDCTANQVNRIAIGMDKLLSLFALTQEEQEVYDEANSQGLEVCMRDERKLNHLYRLLRGSSERGLKSNEQSTKARLSDADIRRIQTPVQTLLQESLTRFGKKIDTLISESALHQETLSRMIMNLGRGHLAFQRIVHPDIKKLWEEMGWGGSVDAQVFVLNFFDYFIDLEREFRAKDALARKRTANMTSSDGALPEPTQSSLETSAKHDSSSHSELSAARPEYSKCTTPDGASHDAWCLDYFNYRTLSTLIEFLDEDMNGLIKIKEVNEFTDVMPEGVTLMQWTVYCAYGWLISAHIYRLRIEWLVEKMVATDWSKENSSVVSRYLSCLGWVVAFMRSLEGPDLQDQELLRVTRTVMEHQERSFGELLQGVDYELEDELIRSMMNVSAHRGRGGIISRIEGWILPVLFLVMQHHYRLMTLSETYLVDEDVFDRAYNTVDCLTDLLFDRAHHLTTRFSKAAGHDGRDSKTHRIANGMFREVCRYIEVEDSRTEISARWHLPWQPDALDRLSSDLEQLDPSFRLRMLRRSIAESSSSKDLSRCQTVKLHCLDERYEEIATYRKHYGISLVSSATNSLYPSPRSSTTDDQPSDEDDLTTSGREQHSWIQCDGCLTSPITGLRFKCIDCEDFDYCATCHAQPEPPLLHPNAIAGHHNIMHRFIRMEKNDEISCVKVVIRLLRMEPYDENKPEDLVVLNPVIEHCLSADEDVVQQIRRVFAAHRGNYLEYAASDNTSAEPETPDALRITLTRLLSSLANTAMDPEKELYQMETSQMQFHSRFCDGCDGRICGICYKCADCPDVDFCANCFPDNFKEHGGPLGRHRPIVLPYPTPNVNFRRIIDKVNHLHDGHDGSNPWKLGNPPEIEDNDRIIEGDTDVEDAPPTPPARRCDTCQGSLSGRRIFTCLSCKLFHYREALSMCSECANSKQDVHRPTHILAIVSAETSQDEDDGDDACSNATMTSKHTTTEDLSKRIEKFEASIDQFSKRIDKIEASVDQLVSMVGKLPEMVLRVMEGRAE